MPTSSYQELRTEALPARIESEEGYDSICSRFGDLLHKRGRTAAEDKLADLLGTLIEEYDQRHGMPPDDSTPGEVLQFLLEHSGKRLRICSRSSDHAVI